MKKFSFSVFLCQKQIIEGLTWTREAKGGQRREGDAAIEAKEGRDRERERIREREATSTCMTHSLSLLQLCNSSSMSLSHSHCQRGQTELRAAIFPKYSTTGTIYFTWVTVPVSVIWVVVAVAVQAVNHHWCIVPIRQLCEDKLYTCIQLCLLLICCQGKLRQAWGACLASKYIRVCLWWMFHAPLLTTRNNWNLNRRHKNQRGQNHTSMYAKWNEKHLKKLHFVWKRCPKLG